MCIRCNPAVLLVRFLGLALGVVVIAMASSVRGGPTFWMGQNTNFTQGDPPSDVDVLVAGKVTLTRQPGSWLYNTNLDSGTEGGVVGIDPTPSDTMWAFGLLSNATNLNYVTFAEIRQEGRIIYGHLGEYLTNGGPMVLWLTNENIYLQVTFTDWPEVGGTTFTYIRSTPSTAPSVNITNPASGAVFAAPASVKIGATATVSSGTVTNVAFSSNATPLGSSQTGPYGITTSPLSPGSYSLTAVATAAGVSGTSSVVTINVVTPVTNLLSKATATNNQFSFNYTANPGLRYAIEKSSNLFNWTPVVTNTPSSSPVSFTNAVSGSPAFYRVDRLPNP